MLIIGIDPGISGSICFFDEGKIIDVIEMPTMTEGKKNKRQVNGAPFTCLLFFLPSVIVGISITSIILPSSKKQIDPDIPGSIPIININ